MRICEIFVSLQGEGTDAGTPCTFVRLAGCNLRCSYCDTEYAFHGGKEMSDGEISDTVSGLGCRRVCITGGEPLLQDVRSLCNLLRSEGFHVKLETNGSLPLKGSFDIVDMDIKTPSSGESGRMRFSNISKLRKKDELKFVISDKKDYDYSKEILERFTPRCNVIFQPSYGVLKPETLAEWIMSDRINVRLGIQLHKILWGDRREV